MYIEYLHLPQNMYSAQSGAYARAEFERFRTNLSNHLGRPITDEAIKRSLQLYNRVRGLIRAIYARRKEVTVHGVEPAFFDEKRWFPTRRVLF